MALDKDKQKNIILLSIMAVAIIGTLFMVLRNKSNIEISGDLESSLIQQNSNSSVPSGANSDLFSSSNFKDLEDFSDKSFDLDSKGKANPFKPFSNGIDSNDSGININKR